MTLAADFKIIEKGPMSRYFKIGKYLKRIYLSKFSSPVQISEKFGAGKARPIWAKGSLKDPFYYLGMLSVILFGLISLAGGSILKSLDNQTQRTFLATASKVFPKTFNQNLFIESNKKAWPESPDFLLIENNSLQAATPPSLVSPQVLGVLVGEEEPEGSKKEIREYIVKEGDTLSSLAEKFKISLNTIIWANELTEKLIIKPGRKLIIPPVSGIIYHVKSGDTLSEIAKTYKGKIDEIVAFNDLANENDIYIGDILVIPNGVMPQTSKSQVTPHTFPSADNQFIPPLSSPYIITQGLHWYNAVDLSHPGYTCGKPVFATAGGIVQKTGYDRIAGNYIRILHPNNLVTFYGHLSAFRVKTGDRINVGQIIGYIGNTGYVQGITGCHLHFEVRGGRNPLVK